MKLERLAAVLEAAAEETVATACAETKDMAQALCPVKTGTLRNSIAVQTEGSRGTVTVGAEYASVVELGTLQQAAQPFLQPAFSQAKGRMMSELARRLRDA
ncbi:MAG: HK97 gp10 family phage protein [Eubacteriales bacterium]|nr:HK97 gp10 family phage protein [Eubacteriales bacterium]